MTNVKRLNHAVLYVTDATTSAAFYADALGLVELHNLGEGQAIFMGVADSPNDHDLGLFTIGARPATSGPGIGLYHLAWEVETLEDLVAMRSRLQSTGALVGESDHGASKSLYAHDPDGIEFEVMWQVPLDQYDADRDGMRTASLDLDAALAQFGATTTSRTV